MPVLLLMAFQFRYDLLFFCSMKDVDLAVSSFLLTPNPSQRARGLVPDTRCTLLDQ